MNSKSLMDINCDCGESFGNWKMGNDPEMFPLVSSVNLACGFHAGDSVTMLNTVKQLADHDIRIGAHPGLPDKLGFGRRVMAIDGTDAYAYIAYQVGALQGILHSQGLELHHVKPHGCMFAVLRANEEPGIAAARAIADVAPGAPVYWPITPGDYFLAELRRLGVTVYGEIYPDLGYREDGTLVVERAKENTDADAAAAQVERFIKTGCVRTLDGKDLELDADSICVHGDGPNGVEVAAKVRQAVEDSGCELELPSRNATGVAELQK